ncbi:MAG: hypothetical protein JXI33_01305 [Candidatus Aminicenantes bacterium]|nr:hypothetical protein [Candidatus Aminicenantes bacterium]
MKKTIALAICALLIGAVGTYALLKVVIPQWNRSAEANTYWQVTAKLDQGGEAFGYLHTEKISAAVLQFFANLEKTIAKGAVGKQEKAVQAFSMLNMLFKSYGLDEISGLGYSSITLKPGLHRNRFVIHHRPGKNKGLIWNIAGPAPRYLSELNMLAADTALVFFADYDIEKLAAWIGKQGQKMSGQQMEQGLAMMKMGLASAGIDGDRLLKSYGGRLGFLITLNPEKRVMIPMGSASISIPEPGIAFMVQVNDSYLFDLIKTKATPSGQAQFKDEAGVKKIVFPRLPMPFPLEPTIAQKGNWLIAATLGSVVQGVFANEGQKLVSSDDYKAIAYKLPRRGNGFSYISPMLPRLIAQMLRENKTVFPFPAAMEKIAAILTRSKGLCQVWENSDSGLVYTINHGFEISTLAELVESFVEIAAEMNIKRAQAEAAPPVGEMPKNE